MRELVWNKVMFITEATARTAAAVVTIALYPLLVAAAVLTLLLDLGFALGKYLGGEDVSQRSKGPDQ